MPEFDENEFKKFEKFITAKSRYYHRRYPHIEACDYVQEGVLACMGAYESWDEAKAPLEWWACECIKRRLRGLHERYGAAFAISDKVYHTQGIRVCEFKAEAHQEAVELPVDLVLSEIVADSLFSDLMQCSGLTDLERDVWARWFKAGQAQEDIAREYGVSQDVINSRFYRAKLKIKRYLNELGYDTSESIEGWL